MKTSGAMMAIVLLAAAAAATAGPVYVEAGALGRGMARQRGAECLVVLPAHVLGAKDGLIKVHGARGEIATAVRDTRFAAPANVDHRQWDVAVLRVTTNGTQLCKEEESGDYLLGSGAALVLRKPNGGLERLPVSYVSEHARESRIRPLPGSREFQQTMSGALLVSKGREIGMMLETCDVRDARCDADTDALVINFEYLGGVYGAWVSPAYVSSGEVNEKLAALDRATGQRASSDIGQVAALQFLVRKGVTLKGRDLQGVFLADAHLEDAGLSGAKLSAANLARAFLENARLDEARLRFAALNGAKLENAILERAEGAYADLREAQLPGARASGSSWIAADARRANFTGADLRGASFQYADLRNASFDGADLRGAFFIGALLEGASFRGARLENTDFTVARGDATGQVQLTSAQLSGICRTPGTDERKTAFRLKLMETVSDTRVSGGENYRDLLLQHWPLTSLEQRALRICAKRTIIPPVAAPIWEHGGKDWMREEMTFFFDRGLLMSGDRRKGVEARANEYMQTYEAVEKSTRLILPAAAVRATATAATAATPPAVSRSGLVRLDNDSVLVLALKQNAALASEIDWREAARVRLQLEHPGAPGVGAGALPAWGHFFKQAIYEEQIDSAMVAAFREWTLSRARALADDLMLVHRLQHFLQFQAAPRTELKNVNVAQSGFRLHCLNGAMSDFHLVLPRELSTYRSGGGQFVDVHLRLHAVVVGTRHPGCRHNSIQAYVVPEKVELYSPSRTEARLSSRLGAGELKAQFEAATVLTEDPPTGGHRSLQLRRGGQLRVHAEGAASEGRWRSAGERLCFAERQAPEDCVFAYRDDGGMFFVRAPSRARHWTITVLESSPLATDAVAQAHLNPQSKLDVVGVTLGTPVSAAVAKLQTHLNGSAGVVELSGKKGRDPVFARGKLVAGPQVKGSPRDQFVVFSYPHAGSQAVDAMVRIVEMEGGAATRDSLIQSLIRKYGEPSHRFAAQHMELYWLEGKGPGKLQPGDSHACYPQNFGHPTLAYTGGLHAPGLIGERLGDTRACGPTLGIRFGLDPQQNRLIFVTWLVDTRRASEVKALLEGAASQSQKKRDEEAASRVGL
jgi:uncharacterized protein YjbI with pentapeptide repeats